MMFCFLFSFFFLHCWWLCSVHHELLSFYRLVQFIWGTFSQIQIASGYKTKVKLLRYWKIEKFWMSKAVCGQRFVLWFCFCFCFRFMCARVSESVQCTHLIFEYSEFISIHYYKSKTNPNQSRSELKRIRTHLLNPLWRNCSCCVTPSVWRYLDLSQSFAVLLLVIVKICAVVTI